MVGSSSLLALAAALAPALASYQGFNYGSTFTTGAAKVQSDFEAEFKAAQALIGAPGVFNSARLYTMIQGGTSNTVISAVPAAISTKTSLLLGMWCSAGDAVFANELQALKTAISQFGSQLSVAGISVGSEDLYRNSPIGIANKEYAGADPTVLAGYIKQVKAAIAGTALSGVPVGHVDTWTAWTNGTNSAVVSAADFIGVDEYPYYQNTQSNGIGAAKSLFDAAISATAGAVGGKPIWITETGWPTGASAASNLAIASTDNAKTYWQTVGCPLFGVTNTWWYTLQDAAPDTPNPAFGLVGTNLNGPPLYDLSCSSVSSSTSSTAASSSTTAVSSSSGSATSSGTSGATTSAVSSKASSTATSVSSNAGGVGGGGSGSTGVAISVATTTTGATGSSATGSSGSSSSVSAKVSASTTTSGSGSSSSSTTTASTSVVTAGASSNMISIGGVVAALVAFAL